ncbi:MAG: hypothetical protein CVU04_05785 [Bacteroidetes bacterium HGW-Bacteroidetes-20]|nr:MAG: hypothetical protein CVU04_05785 [Bacteroidetes bacterium HGW-Bacteroidetes-20]
MKKLILITAIISIMGFWYGCTQQFDGGTANPAQPASITENNSEGDVFGVSPSENTRSTTRIVHCQASQRRIGIANYRHSAHTWVEGETPKEIRLKITLDGAVKKSKRAFWSTDINDNYTRSNRRTHYTYHEALYADGRIISCGPLRIK